MHKKYLSGNHMISLERPLTIARLVQEIDVYDLDPDHYRSYAAQLMSVTPELAEELASKYIRPENSVVALVGKWSEIGNTLKEAWSVTVYDEDLKVKQP